MKNPNNNTILRFTIDPTATTAVFEIPKDAELFDLGPDLMRGGAPTLWMAADNSEGHETETLVLTRLETGQESPWDPQDLEYMGTTVAAGASKSKPGQMSVRTCHYLRATGTAREVILDLQAEENAGA